MEWSDEQKDELRARWHAGEGSRSIGRSMGMTPGQIAGAARRLRLQFHGNTRRLPALMGGAAVGPYTKFRSTVRDAPPSGVLKGGDNQRKLGARVQKGRWKGFPIFSLTLEERATCPADCPLWNGCYGDNMGRSVRYRPGDALMEALAADLDDLQYRHPRGFVVRLHILGDFPSLSYAAFWIEALWSYPALRVFGYTHWQAGTPIGDTLRNAADLHWDRFAIRISDGHIGPVALTVDTAEDAATARAIICPAQTGKTDCCATCALCWATQKPIAFLVH